MATAVQLIMKEHVFVDLNDQRCMWPVGFPTRFVSEEKEGQGSDGLEFASKEQLVTVVDFICV